jgi:hypothetical protein
MRKSFVAAFATILLLLGCGAEPMSGSVSPAPTSAAPEFPWPPPRATTSVVLDSQLFANTTTLMGVSRTIDAALSNANFGDRRYMAAPGGFALVTRLEHIREDGTPLPGSARWTESPAVFSISDYLRALVSAPEGHYRVLVFVVSDVPFGMAAKPATRAETDAWMETGVQWLPEQIGELPFTPAHRITVLVYQFRKVGSDPPVANPNGPPASEQLARSGLNSMLRRGETQ